MLKKYIYYRRGMAALLIIFMAVFAVTFILYRLPLRAVIYPIILCSVFLIIAVAVDYCRQKRQHDMLSAALKFPSEAAERMPEPNSVSEEDLEALIEALKEEMRNTADETSKRERETIDYYTTWVHQIKTPIAAMRLTLQGEDSPLSRRVSSELSRIEQYVGMVLAYLRLGSDSTDYIFKEYDLDEIIRSSVKKFAPEFIDRKLRLDYSPVQERIITDEKWFSFVLEQLLSNALKYTPEGSVKIYIKDHILYIRDEGIGISGEDLPRIFEKGFTGINGRLDKKASGLGLYLCREICKNLSIGISITSEPGKGTLAALDLNQHKISGD